jgi:hypothetical protein
MPSELVTVNLSIYPCQGILDNPPNAGHYNTFAECECAYSIWLGELRAGEKEYGSPIEVATPGQPFRGFLWIRWALRDCWVQPAAAVVH